MSSISELVSSLTPQNAIPSTAQPSNISTSIGVSSSVQSDLIEQNTRVQAVYCASSSSSSSSVASNSLSAPDRIIPISREDLESLYESILRIKIFIENILQLPELPVNVEVSENRNSNPVCLDGNRVQGENAVREKKNTVDMNLHEQALEAENLLKRFQDQLNRSRRVRDFFN